MRAGVIGGLSGLILSACASGPPSGVRVDRQILALSVLLDGSISVREELLVRVSGPSPGSFSRIVTLERADEIFDVTASLDGQALPPQGGDRTATVDRRGSTLGVVWRFPAGDDAPRRFTLEYRAAGAVARQGDRGMVRWPVLPLDPDYPSGASQIDVTLPAGSELLAPPLITADGWDVEARADGFRATATQAAGRGAPVFAAMDFSVERLGITEPVWHFRRERARDLAPAWASSGICMALIGFGVVWMVRLQYPARRRGPAAEEPSIDLARVPPGMLVAMARRRGIRGEPEWQATAAGLAGRAATSTSTFAPAGGPHGDGLSGHERIVADEMWLGTPAATAGTPAVPRRALRAFRAELTRDLVDQGWASSERLTAISGLRTGGLAVVVLGVVTAAGIWAFLQGFGAWPYALPAGTIVGGLTLIAAGGRLSMLTDGGERAAAAERAARRARPR